MKGIKEMMCNALDLFGIVCTVGGTLVLKYSKYSLVILLVGILFLSTRALIDVGAKSDD